LYARRSASTSNSQKDRSQKNRHMDEKVKPPKTRALRVHRRGAAPEGRELLRLSSQRRGKRVRHENLAEYRGEPYSILKSTHVAKVRAPGFQQTLNHSRGK